MITEFTPLVSLGGGLLIGLGAVLLMLADGRIFGATGVLTGVLLPHGRSDWIWRAVALAGMMTGPFVFAAFSGHLPEISVPVSKFGLIVGGVIVGIGVTLGAGCTSGHGVCGLARLSPRSAVAVVTFMVTAGLTVFTLRHLL
ncbi:hypothetical protein AQS8620_02570 [Aquimixticola soesokkakensis]|uniref:Sulphur transport domain-containing protein n=1 Tax=Aquimixticola soesokkakensis TaxID=1519096 RepID=A0A1Y5TD55_9RHOB|nr:YeeE/YedE family protein [Aquimixticola soesokkakensis]SLN57718.1 hypothetical protein AQS8620_02570 [Aquimixticola soesokkakensis]